MQERKEEKIAMRIGKMDADTASKGRPYCFLIFTICVVTGMRTRVYTGQTILSGHCSSGRAEWGEGKERTGGHIKTSQAFWEAAEAKAQQAK